METAKELLEIELKAAIKAVALAGKIGVSKEIMQGLRLKRTEAFYAYGGLNKK